MREIKFRAWHKGYQALHYNKLEQEIPAQMLYDCKPGDCLFWRNNGQNIESVMQYTGLKDKNGKEIYEGDVVTTYHGAIAVVKWGEYRDDDILDENDDYYTDCDGDERNDVGFHAHEIKNGYKDALDSRTDKWIEVVGNVYENPELIKKDS